MDVQLSMVLYWVQQILTSDIAVVCFGALLMIPILDRFIELKRWNNGTCRKLNKRWKKHSIYKTGSVLYVANQYHVIISHDSLIDLPQNKQITLMVLMACMMLLLVLSPIVAFAFRFGILSDPLITSMLVGIMLLPAIVFNGKELIRKLIR